MRKMLLVLLFFSYLAATPVYAQGKWVIDQETQCQVWDSDPKPNQSITWSGECENGKADGEGVARWYEKNKEIGSIQGVMKEGRCQGECFVRIAVGKQQIKYVGQLEDNNLHGKGTFTWPDGNEYSGDWLQGKRHGKGRFIWKNGTEYIGDWKEDKSTGQGTYTWVDRDEKEYSGEVKDGKFHGNGVITYATGDKYSGSWVNGKKHGKGTYTFNDGTPYKGIWENDKRILLVPRLRDFLVW
ncbi:MAG: hypothetical protein D3924_05665 [Candidatus Electrothrix sp. AR4]|nr:hypothetical protein [Candidatus Electrothrix sp. AR4]